MDWSKQLYQPYRNEKGEKGVRIGLTRLDETVFGNEESIRYILDFINKQDFSFDGFICFSQGAIIV